jgi:hypothetical protein
VLGAELWLPASGSPGLLSVSDERGGWVIQAYTALEHAEAAARDRPNDHLPADITGWQTRSGRELARNWPAGHDLEINPNGPASARISGRQLRAAALAETQ